LVGCRSIQKAEIKTGPSLKKAKDTYEVVSVARETVVIDRGEQIMGQGVHSATTAEQWAATITEKVYTIARELGVKGYKLADINSASSEQLQSLSGIDVLNAQKIVAGRPYRSTDELLTKAILSQITYDRMKSQIVAKHLSTRGKSVAVIVGTMPVKVSEH
jgi:DNA uptake protein ComE-like DNA-binding protein